MSESLREQLLRAGLGRKPSGNRSKDKPRRVRSSGNPKPAAKPAGDGEMDLAKAYALRARSEREAQRQAEAEARERKERRQKLAELLAGKALNDAEADIARHFPHADKILRIWVNEAQLSQVNGGQLAVVAHRGRFLLVTRETAMAVRAIEPRAIALLCDPDGGEDDGVPNDLMW